MRTMGSRVRWLGSPVYWKGAPAAAPGAPLTSGYSGYGLARRGSTIEDKKELARELESLLPEAFAVVKNACRRLCGTKVHVRGNDLDWEMIPYDVQLVGGMALHN